uniref:60S ribosomal protein L7a n=1 Tax=Myxobolus squamalis TaxID=59785 RepID=A0A6B2G431_MYXSQ
MVLKNDKSKIIPSPFVIGEGEKKTNVEKKILHPMIAKRSKSFGIGRSIQPKSDLSRFVKWPKYVRIQRQEKILNERLKAPPALNQFRVSLDSKLTANVIKFSKRYSPETTKGKKFRLTQIAKEKIRAEKQGISSTPSSKKTIRY